MKTMKAKVTLLLGVAIGLLSFPILAYCSPEWIYFIGVGLGFTMGWVMREVKKQEDEHLEVRTRLEIIERIKGE